MKETPNFLDIAMQAAIRRDIPTDERFFTALGERSAVVIEGLFSAPAVKARQRARIARSLEQFIGAYPTEIDE